MVSSHRLVRMARELIFVGLLLPTAAGADCVQGDCRNGPGRYQWSNGATYEGHFKDGAFDGNGTYTFADGARYRGEWVKDKKSGRGTYTWSDGKSYDGQWSEDEKQGYGVFQWPDGTMYKGEFRNNERNGLGIYSWPNGARYEGEWIDGKKQGAGIYTFPDGSQTGGTWEGDQQTVKREVADVRVYLDTLQKEMPAATAPVAAAKATPAAGAGPPPSAPATPVAGAATGGPLATAFQLSVLDTALGSGETVAGLTEAPLVTRGDHRPAALINVTITPTGGTEKGYGLRLALTNQSRCNLNFDGLIQVDDTYFPLVSWREDQAVGPGATQQTTVEVRVGSGLFGEAVRFKAQGFGERCTQ